MYYVVLAILAAGCPDKAAFMADEPTTAILGQSSLKYNTAEYLDYMKGVIGVCESLNEQGSLFLLNVLFQYIM